MTEFASLVISVDSRNVTAGTDALYGLERAGGAAEKSTDALYAASRRLAVGMAAVFATLKVADIVKTASRYDELGIVMGVVGENAGHTRQELDLLDASLRKQGISALESRNNIAKMIQANIDLSKATQLARLAQDAAVIGNINSSEAFQTLIYGIQSAQTDVLRTIGLNVNFEQSYKTLAQQIGKTSQDLSENEKLQARVNAVMKQAPAIAGVYEASLTNAGKALRSTERLVQNLEVALGSAAQGPFSVAVDGYTQSLKFLDENIDSVVQVLETGLYVAVARGVTLSVAYTAQLAREVAMRQAAAVAATEQAIAQRTLAMSDQARGMASSVYAAEQIAAANATIAANARAAAGGLGLVRSAGAGLLGIMGGPVGLAVTAGAIGLSFIDWSNTSGKAADSTEDFAAKVARLTGNMRELQNLEVDKRLKEIENEIKANTDLITSRINAARGAGAQGTLGKADNEFIQEIQGRLATLGNAYQRVASEKKGALSTTADEAIKTDKQIKDEERLLKEYENRLKRMKEEVVLFGVVGNEAKLRYETERGELAKLTSAQKSALIEQAKLLDGQQSRKEGLDFMASSAARLDSIRNSLASETSAVMAAYVSRQTIIEQAMAYGQLTQDEAQSLSFDSYSRYQNELTQVAISEAQRRMDLDAQVLSSAGNLANNLVDFTRTIGAEQTTLGRAVFATSKAIQVGMALINAEASAASVLAGYSAMAAVSGPAAPAVITQGIGMSNLVRGLGYASAAAIAATGIAEISGGRALGGQVQAGRSYMVGERGPELFTPGNRGNITTNEKLKSSQGGTGHTTIINQTSARIDSVEEKTYSNGDRILILKEATDAVASALSNPNSSVSKSLSRNYAVQRSRS